MTIIDNPNCGALKEIIHGHTMMLLERGYGYDTVTNFQRRANKEITNTISIQDFVYATDNLLKEIIG